MENKDIGNKIYKIMNHKKESVNESFNPIPLIKLFDYFKNKFNNKDSELDVLTAGITQLLKDKKLCLYEKIKNKEFIKLNQDMLHETDLFMRPNLYISISNRKLDKK